MQFLNRKTTPKPNIKAAAEQGELNIRIGRLAELCTQLVTKFVAAHDRAMAMVMITTILTESRNLAIVNMLDAVNKKADTQFNRAYLAGVFMGVLLGWNAVTYGGMIGRYFGQYLPF